MSKPVRILSQSRLYALRICLLFLVLRLIGVECGWTQRSEIRTNCCLIVYDSSGEWGWIGNLHAQMLANLLGHFPLDYQIHPVENYQHGDMSHCRAVFYFGNTYDNLLPSAFLQDVMTSTHPVCWFLYNLWQLSDSTTYGPQFRQKFGFQFDYLDSSGYSNVSYKTEVLSKNLLEPELGHTTILASNIAQAPAIAWQENITNAIPYIVHGSNFWYIADSPFSYIDEEDRYLVFADILHDIVQTPHAESHPALIRLEDIDPTYPSLLLREAVDYLSSEGVPFAVSVIPTYTDPFGRYNNGVAETVFLPDAPECIQALEYAVSKGGQIIMHGYTHQYGATNNPYTGVTGDDYEFFRVTVNAQDELIDFGPLTEDSVAWVQNRLQSGLALFAAAGLRPIAWETPHYAASALDYSVFGRTFFLTTQRTLTFDSLGHYTGQFFPYTIEKDIYGQKILPENLGNIDPDSATSSRLPSDLVRIARKMRVVRDGAASAFFHPYLDLNHLRELVQGVKALGYTYVPFANPPAITHLPTDITVIAGATVSVSPELAGTMPFRFQWQLEGANLPAATNSCLALTNVQAAQAGSYTLVVSNSVNAVTSAPVRVQVLAPLYLSIRLDSLGGLIIEIMTQPNLSYTLEFTSDPVHGSWTSQMPVPGTGNTIIFQETNTQTRLFYRMRVD